MRENGRVFFGSFFGSVARMGVTLIGAWFAAASVLLLAAEARAACLFPGQNFAVGYALAVAVADLDGDAIPDTGALAGLAWMLPPIAQPPAYHAFADQRACWGLPNCLDTASNALFVLAGALGLRFVQQGQGAWRDRREAWPYGLFFLAMILVGLASGYYHLAPDNARLLGDRLAMMLAFMAWFSAIVCERVGPVAGVHERDGERDCLIHAHELLVGGCLAAAGARDKGRFFF